MAHPGPMSPETLQQLQDALASVLQPSQWSTAYTTRIAYARDQWPRSLIKLRQGKLETPPDIVIWPQNREEAAHVLAICQRASNEVRMTAAGGGSAVTGATSPQRGGVIIDLKRLNKVRWIDLERGIAELEAGMLGMHLEEALNRAGATLGHFPSSIMCSTLGGWAAARSAGQGSSRYGKIEDMIVDIELATPEGSKGRVEWRKGAYDPTQLIVGSEGRLGLITACRVRIHPTPVARSFRGILFPTVEAGLSAIQAMMQSGDVPPTILRLYDPVDTAISSHKNVKDDPETSPARRSDGVLLPKPTQALVKVERQKPGALASLRSGLGKRLKNIVKPIASTALQRANASMGLINAVMPASSLMILGTEGHHQDAADALLNRHLQRCLDAAGEDLGTGPGWHWFDGRYNVSFKQSTVFVNGAFSDTMEVVARWPQVLPLYHAVRNAIGQDAVVMAHFSHAYPDGCSIYFSFAAVADEGDELERYDRIWQRGLAAAAELGAGVSHHHGIGFSKAHAMAQEWGPMGMRLMRALRESFDPHNQLNPGKLDLDPPTQQTPQQPNDETIEARLRSLMDALPHLPWSTQLKASEEEAWQLFGNNATEMTCLTLHNWRDVQSLLRANREHRIPIYTSVGPEPSNAGIFLHLPLPVESPPSFHIDRDAMLLECDSRFSMEVIESYARMEGYTTGVRGDIPLTLQQWIDRGHHYAVNVQQTLIPTPIYNVCALLPDGEELSVGRGPRASSGPDIKQLFWHTGGAFGIVKRATLRLRPVSQDVLVWRTSHVDMDEAIQLLRQIFKQHQPPLELSLWHALPNGPSRLTIRFEAERSPAILEQYQKIEKVQELSALPSPPLPSTPWWYAVAAQWPDLAAVAKHLSDNAPWPLMRLHLVQANHEGGVWLISYSPKTEAHTAPKQFQQYANELMQHPLVTGVWGDPRFVHMPELDPSNAKMLQAIKHRIDPDSILNSHALVGQHEVTP